MLETDFRRFRFSKLNTDEFRHLKLLIFWPIFGLFFTFVERFYNVGHYYSMHCPLDDMIPFCEWFLIPYLFWFVYLIGTIVYTFFFDVAAFKRMMYFIIITYSITMLIYLVFPTCQDLRPTQFARDNVLTRFVAWFYNFDTNTNVCPSIHVRLRRRNARSVRLQAAAKPEAEASLHPALCADMHLDSVYEAAFGAGCSGGAAAVRDCLPHMLQSGTA